MSAEALATDVSPATCASLGHCPLCAEPNQCRLESGEGYKGPCWCERPTVSAAALRRLLADLAAPRCLCPGCLKSIEANPEISRDALVDRGERKSASASPAPAAGEGDFYWEGAVMVFTERYHLRRGSCCGSGCRHCPFARCV